MSDKEVRTACCKQGAPDVKDIQISAQNTPLFLPNHWRHKSMKEKTPKTKQLLHYKSTIVVLRKEYFLPLRLVEHHERMVIKHKKS